MKIVAEEIYHIYNQGNNRETIFYSPQNYLEFLNLFRKFVAPFCKVLSYCLMPNHYHFLIFATKDSEKPKLLGNIETCELSNGFRLLQSTYAKYINKEKSRTGSLFKQKTQAKSMHDGDLHYEFAAFQYIHQNPLKANLVSNLEKWPYSSYVDYAGLRNGTLCDKELAFKLIGFDKDNFVEESYREIDGKQLSKLFYRMDHW
jgi:putative transposase